MQIAAEFPVLLGPHVSICPSVRYRYIVRDSIHKSILLHFNRQQSGGWRNAPLGTRKPPTVISREVVHVPFFVGWRMQGAKPARHARVRTPRYNRNVAVSQTIVSAAEAEEESPNSAGQCAG